MKLKNNNGITLLSLAITVSVMTILLTTVLVIALRDEGVIKVTKEAKKGVEDSSLYQSVTEAVVTSKNKNGKINESALENKLQVIDENANLAYDDTTSTYTVTVKEKSYIIEEYGNITVQE